LHDELGGLLVSARMDLSWRNSICARDDPDIEAAASPSAAKTSPPAWI